MSLGIVFGARYPNALQAAVPLISETLSGAVELPSLEYAISLHRQVFSEGRQELSPNVLILHPLTDLSIPTVLGCRTTGYMRMFELLIGFRRSAAG